MARLNIAEPRQTLFGEGAPLLDPAARTWARLPLNYVFTSIVFFGVQFWTPLSLQALSTSMGPYGLGAASLGAGGAAVATASGSEALLWNPAAMPGQDADVGYYGGLGGPSQSLQQDIGYSGPVDRGIYGGMLLGDQLFPKVGNYHEDTLGAGLSAGLGRWVSVGMLQKLDFADPGALRGWAMDVGALATVPLGGAWKLRLGASGSDLLSSLAWGDGLQEDQAAVTRLGAALEAAPGTWLSYEQDTLDLQGNGGLNQWRAGAQVALFGQALQLRAGATRAEQGSLYGTAGLGALVPGSGGRLEGDYAVLIPAEGNSDGSLRQVFSLKLRFESAQPAIKAALAQVLKDGRGKLRLVRIALASGPQDVQEWSLELKDRHGRTVKVLKGTGMLPPGVVWDGKDGAGQPVDAQGLNYVLRATRASGDILVHHALLAPAADLGISDALAVEGGGDFGLRTEAPAAAVKPKVMLKGGADLAVAQADFDLSGVSGAGDAQSWELRIVDASGHTVRTMAGKGRPPKSVHWEGTDDLGQPLGDSLGTSFEVRVTSADGVVRVAAVAPLVSQADLEDMVGGGQAQNSPPEADCERDPYNHQMLCVLYFEKYLAELTDSDREALVQAALTARKKGLKSVEIAGHADHEGDRQATDQLSQDRADEVMRFLMGQNIGLLHMTVEGWADTRPAADSDTARGRARNRRVVVRFKESVR
jgi:outer membrane protein OmpA-like peptidoglycan-associated protein